VGASAGCSRTSGLPGERGPGAGEMVARMRRLAPNATADGQALLVSRPVVATEGSARSGFNGDVGERLGERLRAVVDVGSDRGFSQARLTKTLARHGPSLTNAPEALLPVAGPRPERFLAGGRPWCLLNRGVRDGGKKAGVA